MVYVDADKENNWNYFDAAVKGCRRGAVVIVDNVVQGGKDERVSATVLQTVGEGSHDGFLYAVVL
ncbi:hypothetical protein E4T47_01893 [Aureobasidium subglaciale]|nr:hypothetical protein E4T47_01893 [Aureobasidium subglaciale]